MASLEPERDPKNPQALGAGALLRELYERESRSLYFCFRAFMPESEACQLMFTLVARLRRELPLSGYQRHARIVLVQIATRLLFSNHSKPRIQLLPPEIHDHPAVIRIQSIEWYVLILRDFAGLSLDEIASGLTTSLGTIQLRLQKARRALAEARKPSAISSARPEASRDSTHFCPTSQDKIEQLDLHLLLSSASSSTSSALFSRVVQGCARCEESLIERTISVQFFLSLSAGLLLPQDLRQLPDNALIQIRGAKLRWNWAAAPWQLRLFAEGLLAASLLIGVVLSIPQIKSLYDFWQERRFDAYSLAELATENAGVRASEPVVPPLEEKKEPISTPAPPTQALPPNPHSSNPSPDVKPAVPPATAVRSESEFIGKGSEKPTSDRIYRILIRSASPETLKAPISQIMGDVHAEPSRPQSLLGEDLPGGVIFDVFVPFADYEELKKRLSSLGDEKPTLIISRAKQPGRPARAHVTVWLQRM